MSTIAECPGCMSGHHEEHVGPWNLTPGLLGGASCGCKGDCAERANAAFAKWSGAPASAPRPDAADPPALAATDSLDDPTRAFHVLTDSVPVVDSASRYTDTAAPLPTGPPMSAWSPEPWELT